MRVIATACAAWLAADLASSVRVLKSPNDEGQELGKLSAELESADAAPESLAEADSALTYVDIMVVWTRAFECGHSGKAWTCSTDSNTQAKVVQRVDRSIANANTALRNSNINGRLRLVRKARHFNFVENRVAGTSGGMRGDLGKMNRCEISGFCNVRDNARADITVAFTVGGGASGMALFGPDRRYNNAIVALSGGEWTLAHELGHLFGCREDRGSTPAADACSTTQTYFGYRTPDSLHRDLMSLNCLAPTGRASSTSGWRDNNDKYDCTIGRARPRECKRMNHYSDPDIWYNASTTAGVNKWIRTGDSKSCCACRIRSQLSRLANLFESR